MSSLEPLLRLPPLSVLAGRLDRAREAKLEELVARGGGDIAMVAEARARIVDAPHDESAARAIEDGVQRLLVELRGDVGGGDRYMRGARWLDENVVRSERGELLDRDGVPRVVKRYTMRLLHRFNAQLGSYRAWADAIDEVIGSKEDAHIYDLAAGTGGFGRWLARHQPDGRRLRITSSDLEREYVEIGAAAADAGGVEFEVRDALDLRELRDRGIDLFVCTQATHHMSPGMVVRLIAQAVAAASAGILIVDIMRSVAVAAGTLVMTSLLAPFPPLVGDGVQSVRRSYTPVELRLFATLAGAKDIDARRFGPAHVLLHARR